MAKKTTRAGELTTRCLEVMDQLRATREPVVITKRGRQVAKPAPVQRRGDDIFGCLKGMMEIVGDIESPLVAPEDWDANQ